VNCRDDLVLALNSPLEGCPQGWGGVFFAYFIPPGPAKLSTPQEGNLAKSTLASEGQGVLSSLRGGGTVGDGGGLSGDYKGLHLQQHNRQVV